MHATGLPKVSPQLCRAAPAPPTDPGWVHEIKHDGHRIIATIDRGQVRLLSRPGNDATRRFAPVGGMAWQGPGTPPSASPVPKAFSEE